MSETQQILLATAAKVFAEEFTQDDLKAAAAGVWLGRQWAVIEELGLPLALVPEDAGGFDVAAEDALALVRLAAEAAVPLPLAETMFANHLLAAAGLGVAEGALSVAPVLPGDRIAVVRRPGGWRLEGMARAVPWGRDAAAIAVVATDGDASFVARVRRGGWQVAEEQQAVTGWPTDQLNFAADLGEDDVRPLPACLSADVVFAGGAALRAIAIAGAMRRILAMTVGYVSDRVQFGRPLARFQAIQHDIASIASQATAAGAAGDMAAAAFAAHFSPPQIAAAKSRAGEAAGIAAALAHQLHGAIGVTDEYRLHYLTKQLWAWRDDFGNEAYWNERLGRQALLAGAAGLWPLLTSL